MKDLYPSFATNQERNDLCDQIIKRENKKDNDALIKKIDNERYHLVLNDVTKITIQGKHVILKSVQP